MQKKVVTRKDTTYVYTPKDRVAIANVCGDTYVAMRPGSQIRVGLLADGSYSVMVVGPENTYYATRFSGYGNIFVEGYGTMTVRDFYNHWTQNS